MTTMGFISESTGKSREKVENMWSDYSDNTGAFQNIENIEISDI